MASKEPAAQETMVVPTKDQIIGMYRRLNSELGAVQERMFDLQNKAEEHDLVAECISKLPSDRKCCRLVSGVLVERTVAEVLPVVKNNSAELKKVCWVHVGLSSRQPFLTPYSLVLFFSL